MLGGLGLMGPTDKVGRYDEDGILVSTVQAGDTMRYETGVRHPDYKNGEIIIAEVYDSREEAEQGHERWVETMTGDDLPEYIDDNPVDTWNKNFGNEGRRYREVQ